MKLSKIIFLVIFSFSVLSAQTRSNLEIISSLVQNSVNQIENKHNLKEFSYKYSSPENLNLFDGMAKSYFGENSKINEESNAELHYSLNEIKVTYPDVFRDGIFGNFLLKRKILLSGNYSIKNHESEKTGLINESFIDTVDYSKVNEIQNPSLNFTVGNVPDEPFLSGIWEPVIAIGAIAVTIFLFFSVQSK